MSEMLPCDECYQAGICAFDRNPFTVNADRGTRQPLTQGAPTDCFGHCCPDGVLAAKTAYRKARDQGTTGWIPFGTTDQKPYFPGVGRYVAFGVDGVENGTTVIFEDGEPMVLTNVLTILSRRRASQLR